MRNSVLQYQQKWIMLHASYCKKPTRLQQHLVTTQCVLRSPHRHGQQFLEISWNNSRDRHLQINGCGLDSRLGRGCLETLLKLFTPCASITKQYNLVFVKKAWCLSAEKVTMGSAESNTGQIPSLRKGLTAALRQYWLKRFFGGNCSL